MWLSYFRPLKVIGWTGNWPVVGCGKLVAYSRMVWLEQPSNICQNQFRNSFVTMYGRMQAHCQPNGSTVVVPWVIWKVCWIFLCPKKGSPRNNDEPAVECNLTLFSRFQVNSLSLKICLTFENAMLTFDFCCPWFIETFWHLQQTCFDHRRNVCTRIVTWICTDVRTHVSTRVGTRNIVEASFPPCASNTFLGMCFLVTAVIRSSVASGNFHQQVPDLLIEFHAKVTSQAREHYQTFRYFKLVRSAEITQADEMSSVKSQAGLDSTVRTWDVTNWLVQGRIRANHGWSPPGHPRGRRPCQE